MIAKSFREYMLGDESSSCVVKTTRYWKRSLSWELILYPYWSSVASTHPSSPVNHDPDEAPRVSIFTPAGTGMSR
ncbi:MAG: hypothetical protein PHT32_08245, partial [Candidatus Omnitrophica bacterium]|nr:hypothetical protein [Candidatus Omnitrophota bacterium]